MREIKFRVWNKNRKMFIIDGMTPKEIQDDATQSMELPIMTSEDCVWQQYTGLKDKNGVEIYEGDIISISIDPNKFSKYKNQENNEVKWDQNHCSFVVFYSILTPTNIDWFGYEVIGNIYEMY